ncbi:MAG TPA: hypothetical protein VFQ85_05550 [Mycobacteriales bacterium]|jgi:hypothetical protein|nr:hypothetical protein [Mycobacteriales bacterium]
MRVRATIVAAAVAVTGVLTATTPAQASVATYDGQTVRGIAARRLPFALENADLRAASHQFRIANITRPASRGLPATFTADETATFPAGSVMVFVDGVAAGQITVLG